MGNHIQTGLNVKLRYHTPLWVASEAIRTCWDSSDKSDTGNTNDNIGPKDRELIHRVGNKFKHASTLEHITYNFHITGISRACLQEIARHRMANLSVKSTRYTLKELKNEPDVVDWETNQPVLEDVAKKYLVQTGNKAVDFSSHFALGLLQTRLKEGVANDLAKYCLPESYKTELAWSINARSLQNFLSLRTSKSALWEIRDLANAVYIALPNEHKYLFEEYLQNEGN